MVRSVFAMPDVDAVTVVPASPAVAVLDQTCAWRPSTVPDWTSVQPAGAATVTPVEATVWNSSNWSPARTEAGIVALCVVWLSAVLLAVRNVMPAATELTDFVTVAVAPSLSVTVRVTSRVPAVE